MHRGVNYAKRASEKSRLTAKPNSSLRRFIYAVASTSAGGDGSRVFKPVLLIEPSSGATPTSLPTGMPLRSGVRHIGANDRGLDRHP